jgi:sugar lactone lactonase YvrE
MMPLLVHHARALTSESPVWDATRETLWYIDIQGQRLLGYRPRDGVERQIMLPLMPGFVVPARDGTLVLGLENGLWRCDPDGPTLDHVVPVEADDQRTRLNEGKADAAGRIWFGSMDKHGLHGAIGSLYRWSGESGVVTLRTGVGVPNCIDFAPDGRTQYFADTPTRRIEATDVDPATGELEQARAFVDCAEGAPDGATIDAEGALWVAMVGAGCVNRYLPDGTLDRRLPLPVSRPTSIAFGGPDLTTLFVTSQRRFLGPEALASEPLAGALIVMSGAGRGRPAHLSAAL